MTATKRRSVSLSKDAKSDILHRFFMDITKQARVDLKKIENDAAESIYDVIYGTMKAELEDVHERMLALNEKIPLPTVVIKAKKRARVKGSIEPTMNERFQFMSFNNHLSMSRLSVIINSHDLSLLKSRPQYNDSGNSRYHNDHINNLIRRKLISKADEKKIEVTYVKACKDGAAIYEPIVTIMQGVIEILQNIKSTKGLFDAWPECEKFLDLPEESRGELMNVDVVKLNKALNGYYPPAEKSSGT